MRDSQEVAEGLKILSNYNGELVYSLVNKAIVYLLKVKNVSQEDFNELMSLKWDYDQKDNCFYFYVNLKEDRDKHITTHLNGNTKVAR